MKRILSALPAAAVLTASAAWSQPPSPEPVPAPADPSGAAATAPSTAEPAATTATAPAPAPTPAASQPPVAAPAPPVQPAPGAASQPPGQTHSPAPPPPAMPQPTHAPAHSTIAAEERPSTGLGLTIAGAVVLGIGALNLVTAPLCKPLYEEDPDTQDVCLVSSLAVGGIGVAVGTPLLIVGLGQRSRYREWKQQRGLSAFRLTLDRDRYGIEWRLSF